MAIPADTLSESRDGICKPLILVVDDEPLLRRAMARVFGQLFNVLTAGSGSEAQKVLVAHTDIRVVISDCKMEQVHSGIRLLEEMREKFPDIGRILVSGTLDPHDAQRLLDSGVAHAVFLKPFDRYELVETVTRYSSRPPSSLPQGSGSA